MKMAIPTRTGRVASALAALLLVGIGSAVTFAGMQTSPEDNVIYACVSRGLIGLGKGAIRIVDGPNHCTAAEDPLFWQQTADVAIASAISAHEAKTLYAVVKHDGTIVRSSPGVAMAGIGSSGNVYHVDMGRDISACTHSATISTIGESFSVLVPRFASAGFNASRPSEVVVRTMEPRSGGGFNVSDFPTDFHLLVTCP